MVLPSAITTCSTIFLAVRVLLCGRTGSGVKTEHPGQITTYVADDRIPWEYCWLEFDGLRAKETLEITGLSVNHPVYNPVHREFETKMRDEMLYIVRNKKEAPLHLIGHLYIFIDALTRSVSDRELRS